MAIPQNKIELIAAINNTYTKLRIDLDNIPIELTMAKTLDGHASGTVMSVCNLVSYLIGWGELVIDWYNKKQNGVVIDFPESGYKWNELGLLAQKFYKDYENISFENLLIQLEATIYKILSLIDNIDDKNLYEIPFYNKYPLGRMIQLNTSSPYKNARNRIRKWKKQNRLP